MVTDLDLHDEVDNPFRFKYNIQLVKRREMII